MMRDPQAAHPGWLAIAMAGLAAALLGLAACDNDKEADPPAELAKDFKPKIKVGRVWSAGLKGAEHLRLGLRPASDGSRLYTASRVGEIYAFDLNKGKQIWRTRTKLPLSGGPGFGG